MKGFMQRKLWLVALTGIALASTACTVGPKYKRPPPLLLRRSKSNRRLISRKPKRPDGNSRSPATRT